MPARWVSLRSTHPTRLAYYEEFASILEARARERVLKHWRRDWKIQMIERVNPRWLDLTSDLVAL
jgi:putative endonuclease